MRDRILGAVALVAAIAMALGARDYAAPISYEPIGPRSVPMLLAALMGLVGFWMLVRGSPRSTGQVANPEQPVAHEPAQSGPDSAPAQGEASSPLLPLRVILATVAIVIYALVFELLGFTLATALMTVPIARLFGGTWKQGLLTGVLMGVVFYFVFDRLLDVVLPAGLLKGLF